MRFLRMRPAVWAMISCSFSSLTRKVAFGSSSVTTPGNSKSSSFAIDIQRLLCVSPVGVGSQARPPIRRDATSVIDSGSHRCGTSNTIPKVRRNPEWARNLAEAARLHNRLLVAAGAPVEARLDAPHELVAHLAVGGELLLAVTAGQRRIGGRPVLDVGG